MPKSYKWQAGLLLLLLLLSVEFAQAKGTGDSVKFTFKGRLIAVGNCQFINGADTTVDFKDVRYDPSNNNVLESNYKQKLESGMQCTGDTTDNTQMKLSAAHTSSLGGYSLLPVTYSNGTISPNLMIRLRVDGAIQNINKTFNVDLRPGSQTLLEVELVKVGDGKSFVDGTTFSAAATLEMTFI